MTIEHKNITDPDLHEPKGVNSAVIHTVYKANGAGSGTWSKVPVQGLQGLTGNGTSRQMILADGAGGFNLTNAIAFGGVYFVNIATPSLVTYPSIYTKVAPVTLPIGIAPIEFTESNNGRLTYTGAISRTAVVNANISVSQATGASRDLKLALYKNGAIIPPSEQILTTNTAEKTTLALITTVSLVTNDYIELWMINTGASGDVNVYTYRMEAKAFP